MNRREFLVALTVAATARKTFGMQSGETQETILDAGPLDSFKEGKVYDQLRDQGVLIICRNDEVFALSPVCTHKGCKVRVQDDNTFLCKCHKSRFTQEGKVLNGPASKNLLRLKVKLSSDNHVLVRVAKPDITG